MKIQFLFSLYGSIIILILPRYYVYVKCNDYTYGVEHTSDSYHSPTKI